MRIVSEPGVHKTTFDEDALLLISRKGKVFRANATAAAAGLDQDHSSLSIMALGDDCVMGDGG
jgi:hypothetical protein